MSKPETMSWSALTSNKTDSAVPLPAPSTTASYNLIPGAYTQFLFRMNEVKDVAFDQQSGALKMNLANGSTILVQNFKDLARSAETCGRDTVLQFMRDETAANGQMTTKIVNIAPDVLLKTLDPSSMPDGMTIVSMPPAGVTREVVVVPGQKYRFDFDWAGAAKTEDGTNVMLSFKNGGLVILRDFVPVMQGDMPAKMSLTDGTVIDASKLIVTACIPTESPVAKLAAIEPASGERHAASTQPHRVAHKAAPDTAAKVANIEPAAGDGTPGQSGNRGSAGFSSGIDDAGLNGLNKLGPLGQTSLSYNTPRLPEQIVLRGDTPAATLVVPPVTPPPAPALSAQDARVYEDGSVGLSVTTTAPAGTTTLLTISGFPAGWIVDPGLGTFNASTRTWTISVPAGATFTGGPVVHPPANTDGDITKLDVRAVATDTTTGLTSTGTEDIRVITDAVADTPDLSASITNISGMIADLAIATAPTDLDGSEQITAVYVGPLPTGVTLEKGVLQNDGRYLLNVSDLSNVHVMAPAGYNGTVNFNVTSVVTETRLSGSEFDFTNNTVTRTVPVSVNFVTLPDGTPTIGDSQCDVDETIISKETLWATGDYTFNYGPDGPGTVTLGTFSSSGSLMNGVLSSNGIPVAVTTEGNDFIGRAGSVVVFKMMVDAAHGSYRFEQYQAIDHADGSNPNDVIALDFGIKISDKDGDTDTGMLRITLADDAPIAHDDATNITGGGIVSGNVVTNDILGADYTTIVTAVTVNGVSHTVGVSGTTTIGGAFGTLMMSSSGVYTYTAYNGVNGSDVFTYMVRDFDGDTSSAKLTIGTADGVPSIDNGSGQVDETDLWEISATRPTVTGTVNYNFGVDGAGTIAPSGVSSFSATGSLFNGQLTMGGLPVVVTLVGNTYKGQVTWPDDGTKGDIFDLTVNADGSYVFNLHNTFDHADGNNPNDVITLNFGVTISDRDGDADTGVISINVLDDVPTARDDIGITNNAGIATGNVIENDQYSFDDMLITSVTVNGVTVTSPFDPTNGMATLIGAYGTFTINSNGAYTYTARNGVTGSDVLTYTLTDIDGDTSTANLTVGVNDGTPTIGDSQCDVDESIISKETLWATGDYTYNYGSNGAGSVTLNNFVASGSLMNGMLSSGGVPVTVTIDGNSFIGRAGNTMVFKMDVNTANATYRFEQYKTIDHANASNPNDVITLDFGIKITDRDGDTDTGTLRITIADDGVTARDDAANITGGGVVSGNVVSNDYTGADVPSTVTSVVVNGVSHNVASNGHTVIDGAFGTLTIAANGAYSYAARNGSNGGDVFTYTIRDFDGDTSSAKLTIGTADGVPTIGDATGQVDETNLWTSSATRPTVTGTLVSNFGTDGAGTIVPSGVSSFSASGSIATGQLRTWGIPVVVTLVGNTYKGQVTFPDDGTVVNVFDLTVNTDGSYVFNLHTVLDHADGANPNDVITLNFGVNILDRDGDTDTGVISINVLDDAPIARDDSAVVNAAGVATGRVIDNDYYSYDDMWVTSVTVNGVTMTPPINPASGVVTLTGTYGTFTIDSNGVYTYTARNGATGSDVLIYTVTDADGDTSTARLTVGVNDGIPTIGDDTKTVDETNLGPIAVNGALAADYGTNGAGSITARANSFSAGGSLRNGTLTANGQEIAVTLSGNTWIGATVANGMLASVVLFAFVLHNDGTYAFTLNDNLDHANTSDPNDIITLNFGAVITDSDGDTDTGTITINIVDDAPIARNDAVSAMFNNVGTGNVLANDTSTEDPVVTRVVFNNVAHDVGAGAATIVAGDHGTLTINQDGHYTYTPYDATTETICINPVASDVASANDSDFSRNGITVMAINPNTRAVAGDLTWITGDINVDGSWYGEQGVGIAGSRNNFVNGTSEGMRIQLDAPQNDLTITISGFNSMSDFVDGVTEAPLHARVYLDNGSVSNITLTNGWSSGFGLVDYTLTASQFGGRNISSIEVFSVQANADWNLYNVSYDGVTGPGTDTFQYTATDRDADSSTALLTATNTTSLPTVTGSAVEFTDSVQAAINDYVVSTTDQTTLSSTQPANDIYIEQSAYLSVLNDDQNGQVAA